MGELLYYTRDDEMKLETKKIYAISRGSYSDYRILCLFTNRRKAKKFIEEWDLSSRYYGGKAGIETFVLDPNTPEDIGERSVNIYEVEFSPETDEIMDVSMSNYTDPQKLNIVKSEVVDEHGKSPYWIYRIWVEAKNEKGARKIATERYMMTKANGTLPDASKPIIRELDLLDWIKDGKVNITFMK
jgi:hypothetical protein